VEIIEKSTVKWPSKQWEQNVKKIN